MGVVAVSGQLTAGPQSGGGFPTALATAKLALSQDPKPMSACTGTVQMTLAAPDYVELSGVGTGQTVTAADTFYFRSSGPVFLRLTCLDGNNAPELVPAVVPCAGVFLAEFQSGRQLVLLEAKGSGTIEYFASGQQ